MLNFNHLYYFHVAATTGSLSTAAERLGVTQPTVSDQVRQLERRLHVALFDRTNEGLRLTNAGRIAYQRTTVMFREAERMLDDLLVERASAQPPRRVGIAIGLWGMVAHTLLPRLLGAGDRVVCMQTGAFADLYRDLVRGELDLLLCAVEPTDAIEAGLAVRHLDRRPQLTAIAPPDLVLPDAWRDVPLIQYGALSPYREDVDSFLRARHLYPRVVAETEDPTMMLDAATRGLAIAFVPATLAHQPAASGHIRVVGTIETSKHDVVAVYRPRDGADLFDQLTIAA